MIIWKKPKNQIKAVGIRGHKTYHFSFSGGFSSGIQAARFLKKVAHASKKNPIIRNTALDIVSCVESHNFLSEIKEIFYFVRDNIRFVRDIQGTETIQDPIVTLPCYFSPYGVGQGDCDDHVLLLASLLLSIGVDDIRFRIVTFSSDAIEWEHIYLIVRDKNQCYSLDPIAKKQGFGFEAPHFGEKDIKL